MCIPDSPGPHAVRSARIASQPKGSAHRWCSGSPRPSRPECAWHSNQADAVSHDCQYMACWAHLSARWASLCAMTRGSHLYAFSTNSFSRRFSSFLPCSRSFAFMRSSHLRHHVTCRTHQILRTRRNCLTCATACDGTQQQCLACEQ